MTAIKAKIVGDVRGERLRSVGIVVALSCGIAAFFTVLYSYAVLTRAMEQGYLRSMPPSAMISVDHLDEDTVARVKGRPGVATAEARRTLSGLISNEPTRWNNLVLFARSDLQRSQTGVLDLEQGSWPLRGEVAIERDAMAVGGLAIGDNVIVRTADGAEQILRVSGTVHDVGEAQARMENLVYGYVSAETLGSFDAAFDTLVLRVAQNPGDAEHIRQVAEECAAMMEAEGSSVDGILVPPPLTHPHAQIMALLLGSIAVFGAMVLGLAGTIVFNVLSALMQAQRRQIAVMKALGGTRRQISGIYLMQAVTFGVLGAFVGLGPGLLGGHTLSQWMAGFLNFDIHDPSTPAWVFGLVVAVGVGVPVVAALLPVRAGTRVSVREALYPPRVNTSVGTSWLDRLLAKLPGNRFTALAVRNLTRQRTRVVLTTSLITLSGIAMLSALNLRSSMIDSLDRRFDLIGYDLSVELAEGTPSEVAEQAVAATDVVVGVEGWLTTSGSIAGEKITLVGLPAGAQLISFASPTEGEVVLSTELHSALGEPARGDVVQLQLEGGTQVFRVAGTSFEPFALPTAYVPLSTFDDPRVNGLRVTLTDMSAGAVQQARSQIDDALDGVGVRALHARTKTETRFVYDQHMVMIYVFLLAVSGIIGAIGVLGLVTTTSLGVSERRRELGVLRAIGATPRRVLALVVLEGALIGLSGWCVAVLLASSVSKVVGDALLSTMFGSVAGMPVDVDEAGVVIWLVVVLLASALASLAPAVAASKSSIREALQYE